MGFPLIFVFLFAYTFFLFCPKRFRKEFKSEKGAFTNLIVRGKLQVPKFIFFAKTITKAGNTHKFYTIERLCHGMYFYVYHHSNHSISTDLSACLARPMFCTVESNSCSGWRLGDSVNALIRADSFCSCYFSFPPIFEQSLKRDPLYTIVHLRQYNAPQRSRGKCKKSQVNLQGHALYVHSEACIRILFWGAGDVL